MENKNDILSDVQNVLTLINRDEYPETSAYLDSLLKETDGEEDTPFEIANTILQMDTPKRFHDYIITFITRMFELEITDGNADAMNDLGAQYYDGSRGFEQSFEKAVHFYKMAAGQGNRQAQENLGYCYYYGREGKLDYEKAFHYFALGAFDGHLISLYKIGDMYLNGLYVPKNEKEAFYIFIRCIETMTEEAERRVAGPVYLRLGRMFLEGTGVSQDLKSALVCYQKAESYLYDMVLSGDVMYKKSLDASIAGQKKARALLAAKLPASTWTFE